MSTSALERVGSNALAGRASQATMTEQSRAIAEVQAAVAVAQHFPRDMHRAWADMQASCGRSAVAERAFYAVKNRGQGPSVHLARELARIWGNIDYGVRELHRDDDKGESEIQAFAWDQQTNVRSTRSFLVPHERMKAGQRQKLVDLTDVYLNNQNIGARAVRECIFTVLPSDFVAEAEGLCRTTVRKGDGKPLVERVTHMVERFAEIGVTVPRIEARVGRSRGQWNAADVAELGVVFRSIEAGDATADEQFPDARVTGAEVLQQPVVQQPPEPAKPEKPGPMVTTAQLKMIGGLLTGLGVDNPEHRARIVDHLAEADTEGEYLRLTKGQAATLIERLNDLHAMSDANRAAAVGFMTADPPGPEQPTLDE